MQNKSFFLKVYFCLFAVFVQLSCQTTELLPERNESQLVNKTINKSRTVINKESIVQVSAWTEQCKINSKSLFCWLKDKTKMTAIADVKRLLIQQGATSSSVIQVVVSLPKSESLTIIRLFDRQNKKIIEPFKIREAQRDFSEVKNILLYFDKLKANKNYELLVAASDGELLDERIVATLPEKLKPLKFAVISCAYDLLYNEGGAEMWEDLLSTNPHFILQIGDNTYADVKNGKPIKSIIEQNIWERYLETRSILSVYKKHQLIPIFAVWDDHDYGSNDGDRTFALKEKSLKLFKDFYAQEDVPNFFQNGPGASSSFILQGQRFLLMDDRFYRSVNKPSPVFLKYADTQNLVSKVDNQDYETHFGKEGEEFISSNLNEKSVPTWLISGDQFFGAYHVFESYEGNQPESFKNFLVQLRNAKSNVVFVSGDRHLSELMEIEKQEIGYPSFEITSSPIHARTNPEAWARDRNPRQLAGSSGIFNYTIIESEAKKNSLKFKVTAFKPNKIKLYEKNLKVGK